MTLAQILHILKARWRIGALIFAVTVAAALTVAMLLPRQYTASGSIVVDGRPDPLAAMALPMQVLPGVMATQVDIIQSDRVARRVIRALKLTEVPEVRDAYLKDTGGEGDIDTWLVTFLSKNLVVIPSRESNVISIGYRAPNPAFSSAVANAFINNYVETTLELRVNPARQYTAFFDERAKEARDSLEKAQAKLSQFQRDNGILATDERFDVENARLNELSTQLVMMQGASAESQSRQNQAGVASDRLAEVLNNPVVAGLKADLARQQARLEELSQRLGDQNPQVLQARASIGELRERIDAEVKRVAGGVTVSNSINRQREAQIRAELEQQRAKLLKLKALRDEGSVLTREVDNAQRTFDAVLARLNQTSLESQANQSNVSVLSVAVPPIEPSFPKMIVVIPLAIIVGALLGAGVVLILELLDRRLRAVTDVAAALNLPVLGVLPASANQRPKGLRRRLIASAPIAALPGPRS